MAQKLKQFEFRRLGAAHVYEWDKLLDGDIWALDKTKDIKGNLLVFQNAARKEARARDMYVRFGTDDKDRLIMQAMPADAATRRKWAESDARRAAAKAAKAKGNGHDEDEVEEEVEE